MRNMITGLGILASVGVMLMGGAGGAAAQSRSRPAPRDNPPAPRNNPPAPQYNPPAPQYNPPSQPNYSPPRNRGVPRYNPPSGGGGTGGGGRAAGGSSSGGVVTISPGNMTAGDRFNRSAEGYSYKYPNGVYSRIIYTQYPGWIDPYYNNGLGYYPFYANSYNYGDTSYSPYYYYGCTPRYISNSGIYVSQPTHAFLALKSVYSSASGYYLVRSVSLPMNALQAQAARDIEDCWLTNDLAPLAAHTERNSHIAVYLDGKYRYSISPGDYLDLTHDAQRTLKTLSYHLAMIATPAPGVIVLQGEHIYVDHKNVKNTVIVSYALRQQGNNYLITEVGVSTAHQPSSPGN